MMNTKAITVLVVATAMTGIVSALSLPVPIEARAPEAGTCGLSTQGEATSALAQGGVARFIGPSISGLAQKGTLGERESSLASGCGQNP